MKLERVVWVAPPDREPDPGLRAIRSELERRAAGVAWDREQALPAQPAPGTLYLLRGALASQDEASFRRAFGVVPAAVAARTVIDEAARRGEVWGLLRRGGFGGALEGTLRYVMAREDLFRELRPDELPERFAVDGEDAGYTYLPARDDQSQADIVVTYLLALAAKVD